MSNILKTGLSKNLKFYNNLWNLRNKKQTSSFEQKLLKNMELSQFLYISNENYIKIILGMKIYHIQDLFCIIKIFCLFKSSI